MRELAGMDLATVAALTALPSEMVRAFEDDTMAVVHWRAVSRRLHDAYASRNVHWCDTELHDAHGVYLDNGAAGDRQVILAGIALLGFFANAKRRNAAPPRVSVVTLCNRVAKRMGKPAGQKLRAVLSEGHDLSASMVSECFYHLRIAGCHFETAENGGWRGVYCSSQGADWQ
jgi:hypothetical protein